MDRVARSKVLMIWFFKTNRFHKSQARTNSRHRAEINARNMMISGEYKLKLFSKMLLVKKKKKPKVVARTLQSEKQTLNGVDFNSKSNHIHSVRGREW